MSAPLNAALDDAGRRYYTWNGERFWSVTTLIDMGVPKYLVPWASRLIAEMAYYDVARCGKRALGIWEKAGRHYVSMLQAQGGLTSIKPEKLTPADFALRWLKSTPERTRDAAAARGSKVHEQSEEIVKVRADEAARLVIAGTDHAAILAGFDDATRPYMASFLAWVRDFRPRFEATEATVYNRAAGYAGTLDAIVRLDLGPAHGVPMVVDYKTGREIYSEVGLQLAAYRRGEFVGMPDGSEAPMPRTLDGAVLHLLPAPTTTSPHGYEFRRVRVDEPIYRAFLYACEVARFRLETAPTVIGEPILPDLADALAASLEAVGG